MRLANGTRDPSGTGFRAGFYKTGTFVPALTPPERQNFARQVHSEGVVVFVHGLWADG